MSRIQGQRWFDHRVPNTVVIGVVSEADPNDNTNTGTWLLGRLRDSAQKASERHRAPLGVQFIIYMSSPLVRPGFEGVRLGSFSRVRNQQSVLISVPESLEATLREFLTGALEEGLGLALERLRRKQISGDSLEKIARAGAEVVDDLRSGQIPIGH